MEINRKRVARRLASGLLAGALAFGGLALSGASPAGAVPIDLDADQRLGGADRYATSALVAEEIDDRADGADTLIIASGENFPDALAAAPLAGNQPILLVGSSSIPSVVRDRMFRLTDTVDDVYVVGGESAVSAAVFAEIEEIFEDADVMRVAGANRYATAAAIADEVGYDDMVVLVSGTSFADAVTVGGWTANNELPVLLANSGSLPAETVEALEAALDDDVTRVTIVGGAAAVGSGVEDELVELGFAPADITRIAGADRYQTNLIFNLEQFGDTTSKFLAAGENDDLAGLSATLVSGVNFPDALAAAPLVNRLGSHLILVDPVTGGSSLQTLAYAATIATTLDDYSPLLAGVENATTGKVDGVIASLTDNAIVHFALAAGNIGHTFQDLWVIGGTSAVPASVVTIMETVAGGGDMTCSISAAGANGATGPSSVVIAFSGNLQVDATDSTGVILGGSVADELSVLTTGEDLSDLIEVEGDNPTIENDDITALDLNLDGYTDALSVDVGDLAEGDEVVFLGIDADVADYAATNATFLRDFSSCDYDIVEDEDAPTVTVQAIAGTPYTWVEFSEDIDDAAADTKAAIEGDLDAAVDADGDAITDDHTCTQISTDNTQWLCEETSETPVDWVAGSTITIDSDLFKDYAGNILANDEFEVDAAADYAPDIDDASMTCAKVGAGEVRAAKWALAYANDFAVDAAGDANGDTVDFVYDAGTILIDVAEGEDTGYVTLTAKSGATGTTANDWTVIVEQSRGLLRPTVEIDGTTMTVTIDRYFHTAADIVRAIDSTSIGEGGLSSTWDASTDLATGLVPAAVLDEELTTDTSGGTIGTLTCAFQIVMDTVLIDVDGASLIGGTVGDDNVLLPVTSMPNSEGEFRITVDGEVLDLDGLSADGTEWQFAGGVAIEAGTTITAIGQIESEGTMRVEIYIGGELRRLTV